MDISSDSQVVVESPTLYEAPAEPLDMSMFVDRVAKLSQVSGLSSVQLSPHRVCEDFAYDTLDVFPIFQVSPEAEGYFPDTSPVTPQDPRNLLNSPDTLAHGSLPPEATGSLDSFIGSQVTSLSLTEHAADLSLLPDSLISLPNKILLLTMRPYADVQMRPQSSPGRQSPGGIAHLG